MEAGRRRPRVARRHRRRQHGRGRCRACRRGRPSWRSASSRPAARSRRRATSSPPAPSPERRGPAGAGQARRASTAMSSAGSSSTKLTASASMSRPARRPTGPCPGTWPLRRPPRRTPADPSAGRSGRPCSRPAPRPGSRWTTLSVSLSSSVTPSSVPGHPDRLDPPAGPPHQRQRVAARAQDDVDAPVDVGCTAPTSTVQNRGLTGTRSSSTAVALGAGPQQHLVEVAEHGRGHDPAHGRGADRVAHQARRGGGLDAVAADVAHGDDPPVGVGLEGVVEVAAHVEALTGGPVAWRRARCRGCRAGGPAAGCPAGPGPRRTARGTGGRCRR